MITQCRRVSRAVVSPAAPPGSMSAALSSCHVGPSTPWLRSSEPTRRCCTRLPQSEVSTSMTVTVLLLRGKWQVGPHPRGGSRKGVKTRRQDRRGHLKSVCRTTLSKLAPHAVPGLPSVACFPRSAPTLPARGAVKQELCRGQAHSRHTINTY